MTTASLGRILWRKRKEGGGGGRLRGGRGGVKRRVGEIPIEKKDRNEGFWATGK